MLVSVALLAAVVVAQPQRYSQQNQQIDNQQQQRYYIARQEEASAADAPYPASGWRPAGRVFSLPQRQFAAVQQSQQQYGAPAAPQPQGQYGTPQQQYGAPEQPAATTETPDNTDDEEEVSTVQSISSSEVSRGASSSFEIVGCTRGDTPRVEISNLGPARRNRNRTLALRAFLTSLVCCSLVIRDASRYERDRTLLFRKDRESVLF